ncbi:Hok/Gef family protein [Escherichia coli]|uniref:Hok/Gef family protein n=1 Tax=Escherichia coli TaxID=562 RepID=UPI00039127CA|nr:protein SrnB [Escherichia coli HVH 78 (4-2735946)]EQP61987.1 protein SrnB [Escherichia coli HVH 78 (4-2735946)]
MLGGADNPNGELLSYIIGADIFAKMSKFMTKYTLIGLLAVCATVLCFSLIFREQLCELNIHRGNTVVQVTLA